VSALLLSLLLTQAPAKLPGGQPKPMNEQQRCLQACGQKIMECEQPCAPKAGDGNKPDKRKAYMACSNDCAAKNMPCVEACKGKKKDKP
jgi:hypothetical protein